MVRSGILQARRGAPRAVIALIAIWLVHQILTFIVFQPTDAFGESEAQPFIVTVLQFGHRLLLPVLFGFGLLKRLRSTWVLAFVWQAIGAAFGVLTFTLSNYGWSDVTSMSEIGFYGGALPIVVAVISFVILLLPTTQRWVRDN